MPRPSDAVSSTGSPHFEALDSLRGLAALSVVLYHMAWVSPISQLTFIRNGDVMVDLFFVLSGFVITYSYGRKVSDITGLRNFVWLRFWRLWPLHVTFLVVMAGIEFLKYFAQIKLHLAPNEPAFSLNNGRAFLANLFLIQALHTTPAFTFNGPAWSISTEFWTYILFGLTVLALPGSIARRFAFAILSAGSFVLLVFVLHRNPLEPTIDWGILRCIMGFFLGSLAYEAYEAIAPRVATRPSAQTTFDILAGAGMACFVVLLCLRRTGGTWDALVILPLIAFMILACASSGKLLTYRVLTWAPLHWLGKVSYSIYMVHLAILWCIGQVIRVAFKVHQIPTDDPLAPGRMMLNPPLPLALAACALGLALVLLVSWATFAWIEDPWRIWSKTRLRRRPVAAPSLADT
ncbi:MAG TPA: acyltransferase [Rhizomicrobium sp.]|jgi:peptidoglycan/LPS O-acetylase OafA/YrhL|nr:acyltransferase [Rhizomicrobium sp.]